MPADLPTRSRKKYFELGACSKCMRTSFLVALFATTLAGLVTFLVGNVWILVASWGAAVALVGLWISHLAAYALREAKNAKADPTASLFIRHWAPVESSLTQRRQFLLILSKAFAFAALATMIPSAVALAQTPVGKECKITNCWEDQHCKCKYPSPVCVSCAARNEAGCAPVDMISCCSPAAFWLCPKSMNCNGDGTQAPLCR